MLLRQGRDGELGGGKGQGQGGVAPVLAGQGRVTGTRWAEGVREGSESWRPEQALSGDVAECPSEVRRETRLHARTRDHAGKAPGHIQALPSCLPGAGGREPCLGLL